ncbi:MAG TPA: hypothetical protein VNF07_11855 [Acidimicrobiales bacterium]|nr:hypothetical protein [Acidimicrobiales bacterium]
MNGYIEAGYSVTLVSLVAYGATLRLREQRALRRRELPVLPAEEPEER